ncbi:MAG: AI-2E family transporter [Myxococcota bacterium]
MTGGRTQSAFLLGLLVGVTILFLTLLRSFIQPIFWAAIMGILFRPVQRRLELRLRGRRSLAALLTVALIFFTVLVPALLVGSAVTAEALRFYTQVQEGEIDPGALIRWLQGLTPQAAEHAARLGIDLDEIPAKLSGVALRGSQFIASLALSAGQNVARFAVLFFLMLYLLFFVLRDGEELLEHIIRALPLGDERERRLLAKFAEVARATIKGTLVVGLVQGALGGLIFWILGLQGPVFWAVVMVILSVIPAVGPALIWAPAAGILLASGAYLKALILLIFGVGVIGLVDNVLRPILIGRDTKMPDYLILLATLGGLTLFGVSGFVIGPIIAALFLSVWSMFEAEHRAAG